MNPDLPGGSSALLRTGEQINSSLPEGKADFFFIDQGCITLKGHANHPSEPLMLILNVTEL